MGREGFEKIKGYNSHFGAVGLRVRGGRRLTRIEEGLGQVLQALAGAGQAGGKAGSAPLRILRFRKRWSSRLDRSSGRKFPLIDILFIKADQFVATVGHPVMSANPVVTRVFIVMVVEAFTPVLGRLSFKNGAIERPCRSDGASIPAISQRYPQNPPEIQCPRSGFPL